MMAAAPGLWLWRHRGPPPDLFDGVWEDEIGPLLWADTAGELKATTIIEQLEEQHPGRFSASQLRTLRSASDQMLLNFGRTRSPGGSSHEIRHT